MKLTTTATRLALALVTMSIAPPSAEAQGTGAGWWLIDPLGAPIISAQTSVLRAGQLYYFETYNLASSSGAPAFPADTVLSIRGGDSPAEVTVAGADSCGADMTRSCTYWTPSPIAGDRAWTVWVRAFNLFSWGRAGVHYRPINAGDPPTGSGPWIELVTDSSGAAAVATFGGFAVQGLGDAAASVQLETSELPGDVQTEHVIVNGVNNENRTVNWLLQNGGGARSGIGSGAIRSHRSFVAGTAQFNGAPTFGSAPNVMALVVTFPTAAGTGPYLVMRNDCLTIHPGTACGAVDADFDSLGDSLEQALGSCDRTTDPDFNGISCAARFDGPAGDSGLHSCPTPGDCNQHAPLSDTDGDGFRDDLELYGWPISGLGFLPRYGASPTHFDLFVDYNYLDAIPGNSPGPGLPDPCDAPPTIDAISVGAIYRGTASPSGANPDGSLDTSTILNRDGTRGIHLHTDTYNVPAPRLGGDMSAGNWGGSAACLPDPFNAADCASVGGAWNAATGVCSTYDRHAWFSGRSRWIWRTGLDRGPQGAQNGYDVVVSSGGSEVYAHELSHLGRTDHGAPNDAREGELMNGSAVAQTRTSYLYDGLMANDRTVTFASGMLPTLHSTGVVEACPFGGGGVGARAYLTMSLFDARPGFVLPEPFCPGVDWNHDGTISAEPVEARITQLFGHVERYAARDRDLDSVPDPVLVSETGDELVVAGGSLVRVRVEGQRFPRDVLSAVVVNTAPDFQCNEAPSSTGSRFPPCGFDAATDGLDSTTDDVVAFGDSVTAAVVSPPGAGDRIILVVDHHPPGAPEQLQWLVLATRSRADPVVLSQGIVIGTTFAGLRDLTGIPSLARIGGTDAVSLLYRDASGDIVEQVGTLDPRDPTFSNVNWSAPALAVAPPSGHEFVGSVGATSIEGGSTLAPEGAILGIGSDAPGGGDFRLQFYHRGPVGGWSPTPISENINDGRIVGRPSLAVRPYRIGSAVRDRLIVAWRRVNFTVGELLYAETALSGIATWEPLAPLFAGRGPNYEEFLSNKAVPSIRSPASPALAYDNRWGLPAQRGLRATYAQVQTCTPVGAACAGGTTCVSLDADQPLFASDPQFPTLGSQAQFQIGVCGVPGTHLIQSIEFTIPGADGVVPRAHESFDEWNTLRDGYCRAQWELQQAPPFFAGASTWCSVHPAP